MRGEGEGKKNVIFKRKKTWRKKLSSEKKKHSKMITLVKGHEIKQQTKFLEKVKVDKGRVKEKKIKDGC